MAYTKYSLTPANNNAAPPDGAPEGMLPSAVNDTMRDMMAQIRDAGDGIRNGTYTMTAPVITGGSITGVALSGNTLTNPVITGGSINNTPIGASTASTGAFTTLAYSSTLTGGTGVINIGSGQFYKDASGNVGIGTSSPNSAAVNRALTISGTANSILELNAGATRCGYLFANSSVTVLSAVGANSLLRFNTEDTEKMIITNTGNVGIGTSSPSQPVELVKNQDASTWFSVLNNNAGAGAAAGYLMTNNTGVLGALQLNSSTNSTSGSGNAVVLRTLSTNPLVFGTNSTERMRIDSSGNLLVGRTAALGNSRFIVKTSSTSNLDYGVVFENSAGTLLLGIDNNGGFATGSAAGSPYNSTTGSAANVFVASTGVLQRSTSSLKYKTDVQDATHGLAEVMQLRPVTYKGKNDGDTIFGGLIAEEVDAIGLTEFVQYAENGTPDALAYGNMVSLAFKAIQELKAEFDAYKATHP